MDTISYLAGIFVHHQAGYHFYIIYNNELENFSHLSCFECRVEIYSCNIIKCSSPQFQLHLHNSVEYLFLLSKPFQHAICAVFISVRKGAAGGKERVFCWDSQLPVHLGGNGSSCHKHCAFLRVIHGKLWRKVGRQKEGHYHIRATFLQRREGKQG